MGVGTGGQVYRFMVEFGIDFRNIFSAFKNIGGYFFDLKKIKKQLDGKWEIGTLFPCIHDKFNDAGVAKGYYFHTDLLVAQEIFKNKPLKHVDVGSSIHGFVSHVASFRKIEVFDIRSLDSKSEKIKFKQMDIMNFQKKYEDYTDSLSCLSVLEHFGLGRYGDDIDVYGYKKGFGNLVKMLKKGGTFYFSVPIGKQRIEFNAHRVFSINEILGLAKENNLEVVFFSYVDDKGNLHKNYKLSEKDLVTNLRCSFGCGIWEFRKK
ncbi:MAG: DUF268 domain-containing protein [Promethearchaeota archaeon]